MNIVEDIRLALNAIRSNFLRTVLTLSIIAVGIMALVGILTSIDGIKASIFNTFSNMGANTFDIRKWDQRRQRRGDQKKVVKSISWDEAKRFQNRYKYPATVSISTLGSAFATLQYGSERTNPNIRVMGADENYLTVAGYDVAVGRNFSETETMQGRQVAIIGEGAAKKLVDRPEIIVGKSVSIGNVKCQIIGLLESKGSGSAFNADNVVILPALKVRQRFPSEDRSYTITVAVDDAARLGAAAEEANGLMRAIRKVSLGAENDFEIATSDKLANSLFENLQYITASAFVIALITLLGAAIGLMNIMLVSVAERTREIGISKAIGASSAAVLRQYLVEAIVICQLGGLFGIVLGILAGNGVSLLINGPFIIPWLWIFVGISFCLIVGLLAGLYPAIKASRLDPIESLRYE